MSCIYVETISENMSSLERHFVVDIFMKFIMSFQISKPGIQCVDKLVQNIMVSVIKIYFTRPPFSVKPQFIYWKQLALVKY